MCVPPRRLISMSLRANQAEAEIRTRPSPKSAVGSTALTSSALRVAAESKPRARGELIHPEQGGPGSVEIRAGDQSGRFEVPQRTHRGVLQVAMVMAVGEVGGDELKSRQILKKSAIGAGEANNRPPAGEPDESGRLGILVVRSRVPVVTGQRIPCCPASLYTHHPVQSHHARVPEIGHGRCPWDTPIASSLNQGKARTRPAAPRNEGVR